MFQKDPSILTEAIGLAKQHSLKQAISADTTEEFVQEVINYGYALVGKNMLQHVKSHVLTQTNPALAFDVQKTVASALGYIRAYANIGVCKEQVIIKVPATYAGLQACRILKQEYSVQTLATTVFTLAQAVAAAEAECAAISPYIDDLAANLDPSALVTGIPLKDQFGFKLARDIHYYYRGHSIPCKNITAAMVSPELTASIAGVDGMTIPLHCMNLLNTMPCPEDFKPIFPKVVEGADVPPKMEFLDNKELFDEMADTDFVRTKIAEAIEVFAEFDTITRETIRQML